MDTIQDLEEKVDELKHLPFELWDTIFDFSKNRRYLWSFVCKRLNSRYHRQKTCYIDFWVENSKFYNQPKCFDGCILPGHYTCNVCLAHFCINCIYTQCPECHDHVKCHNCGYGTKTSHYHPDGGFQGVVW